MENAYSTDRPEVVAAYRQTVQQRREFGQRVMADCAALGGNQGPLMRRGIWGHPDEIIGLGPDGSGVNPDGWRLVRGRLEPRPRKPGEPARRWLAEHQPPDVRHVLTRHGLPRHSTTPVRERGMTYRVTQPALFELDGVLWVCYQDKPGDDLMAGETLDESIWTQRRLSEFHAAREAAEARHAAERDREEARRNG
jgi:hypothetical protein